MSRKISYKYRQVLFALTMSASTALIVSAIILSLQGLSVGLFFQHWLRAFLTAWPIVFVAILVFAPQVNRLLDMVVEKPECGV